MNIIIETPKYSFFKYKKIDNKFKKVFFSPIPILFNYGFIENTKGQDNMPIDVLVLGSKMKQNSIIKRDKNQKFDGIVKFIDYGKTDDKNIIYISGFKNTFFLSMYFRVYAIYKIFLYLLLEQRITKCKFNGIKWFK